MKTSFNSFFYKCIKHFYYSIEKIPSVKKRKFKIFIALFFTTIVVIGVCSHTLITVSSKKRSVSIISNKHPEGIKNTYYLDLKIPENSTIEQNSSITIEAFGNDWYNWKIVWNLTNYTGFSGVTYTTSGENNEVLTIYNNLNSFFDRDLEISASIGTIYADTALTCVAKTQESYIQDNLPDVFEPVILTEEESYEKTYFGLSELFASKSSVALNELNSIQLNQELTIQEKIDKTNELCVTKHISLIDHNTFEKYKTEFIKGSYDEILNTNLINNEQKLEYISLLSKQIDKTFNEIEEQNFITNSELSKYLNDYYLNISQEFSNISPKTFSASSDNKTEEIKENILRNNLAEFINSNQIVLSNSNTFAEDIINEQFKLDEDFSLKNTNYLNNFFQFNDYFDNKSQNLNDSVCDVDVLTKISNIEEFEEYINFNLEYKFDLEDSEPQFFNFDLVLKFPVQKPKLSISEFYESHSFALNNEYCWDDVEENYWDKMFELNLVDKDKTYSVNINDNGHDIYCKRGGFLGWENWDIRHYKTYVQNINIKLDLNEDNIERNYITKLENDGLSISTLKDLNVIEDFDWTVKLFGSGKVYYDDFIGETGYDFSYTKYLTSANPEYNGKAIGNANDYDGAGGHNIHWKAAVNENRVIVKNDETNGLYLHFQPDSLFIENYFYGGGYENGPQNNFYKGNFNIQNGNSGIKINPYEIDVSGDRIENLLLVDGEVYQPEKFENFKVNLLLKDIIFDYINPHIENDTTYGSVTYSVVIYDTITGSSETFDLFENFLVKNITKEMLLEKANYLLEQIEVFNLNIEKYVRLRDTNIAYVIFIVGLQTTSLVYQIISIAKLCVASVTMPWSILLYAYILYEITMTLKTLIDLLLFINKKICLIVHLNDLIFGYTISLQNTDDTYEIHNKIISFLESMSNNLAYLDIIKMISSYEFNIIFGMLNMVTNNFYQNISTDKVVEIVDVINKSYVDGIFKNVCKKVIEKKYKVNVKEMFGLTFVLDVLIIGFDILFNFLIDEANKMPNYK